MAALNNNKKASSSRKNNVDKKVNEWLVKRTKGGREAIRTAPLSTGVFSLIQYSLWLKVIVSGNSFNSILQLRCHAAQSDLLPNDIKLCIDSSDPIEIHPTNNAIPTFSIIHKNYVRFFSFPIEENALCLILNGNVIVSIVSHKNALNISIKKDEFLLYCQLKEQLSPESLNEEQKDTLQEHTISLRKEEERKQQERIAEEKEKERRLLEAKKKEEEAQREEQRKRTVLESWKEKQVTICSKLVLSQLIKNHPHPSNCYFYDNSRLVTYSLVDEDEIKKILNAVTEGLVHTDDEYSAEKKEIFGANDFSESIIQNLKHCLILQPDESSFRRGYRFYIFIIGYTEQLGYDLIDNKTSFSRVKLKILAKACIQNAVVYRNTSIVYDDGCDSRYYDGLRELGIVSDAALDKTLKRYCVLYVTDYQRACDIIDGKRDSLAKNQGGTSTSATSSNGCYIATCVYGSYDCPEVWTLRRYRDQVLDETWVGRLFIKSYYAVSPKLVQWFGNTPWFRTLGRKNLDKLVRRLQSSGFEQTPYFDKY